MTGRHPEATLADGTVVVLVPRADWHRTQAKLAAPLPVPLEAPTLPIADVLTASGMPREVVETYLSTREGRLAAAMIAQDADPRPLAYRVLQGGERP